MTTGIGGRTFDAIEVHAEGEPGRILTSAADLVHGDTMGERLAWCRANLEWLRLLMLHEPRGYPGLCAVLLVPPVNPDSHFGIVVLEQGGSPGWRRPCDASTGRGRQPEARHSAAAQPRPGRTIPRRFA